jgi:hypothetical protein
MRVLTFAIALHLLVAATPALAQAPGDLTAGITGQVTDESGAVLPGVTVTASSPSLQVGQVSDVTNERGEYRLMRLPIGTYEVAYSLTGFQTVRREDVRLTLGFQARIDVSMRIGALEETLTITARPTVVDVTSTRSETILTREALEAIPSGRTGWVSLLNQSPSARSNLDVGGVSAAATPVIRVYGMSSNSWQVIEGVVTTDSRSTQTGNYWDFQSIEEGRIQTIANDANVPARGAYVNAVVKSGGNSFHGGGFSGFMNQRLQSDNVSNELNAQGITQGNPLNYRSDLSFDVGGPLVRDKVWFYEAVRLRLQDLQLLDALKPDGSPATNYQSQALQTVKLTYQITPGNKLVGFHSWQRKREIALNVGVNVPWESRRDVTVPTHVGKVEWQAIRGNSLFTSLQVGHWQWIGDYVGHTDSPEAQDIFTQNTWGVSVDAGNVAKGWRDYVLTGHLTWVRPDLVVGTHEFKVGFDHLPSVSSRQWSSRTAGDYRLIFNDGAPFQIVAFNYPVKPLTSANHTSVYLTDKWEVSRRVTMNVGLRYARDNGFVPEQCREAGVFAEAACTDGTQFKIWNSVSPRLYAAYDVIGDGRTVVKGGWGRFNQWRITDEILGANPFIATQTRYRWRDLNGNRDYEAGEVNLDPNGLDFVSRTVRDAGGTTGLVPNPDEKQPIEDQFSLSLERELMANMSVRASGIYSHRFNSPRIDFLGRPYSAFTIPVTRPDPGPDGRAGTADDPGQSVTYYEYPRELAGVVFQQHHVVTDPSGDSSFKTIELAAQKRLSRGWQLSASYSATRLSVPVPERSEYTPNTEIFSANRTWEWLARVSGSYILPADVMLSANLDHRSGEAQARSVLFTGGVTIPSIVLNVEPIGSQRLPHQNLVDLRAEKAFRFANGRSIKAQVNVFNLMNASTVLARVTRAGPTYLRPTSIMLPRIVEFGVAYNF